MKQACKTWVNKSHDSTWVLDSIITTKQNTKTCTGVMGYILVIKWCPRCILDYFFRVLMPKAQPCLPFHSVMYWCTKWLWHWFLWKEFSFMGFYFFFSFCNSYSKLFMILDRSLFNCDQAALRTLLSICLSVWSKQILPPIWAFLNCNLSLSTQFTDGYGMMHKACNDIEEVP